MPDSNMSKKKQRFGKAFFGEVDKVLKTSRNLHSLKEEGKVGDYLLFGFKRPLSSSQVSLFRIYFLAFLAATLLTLLVGRLFLLTVIEGKRNLEMANSNRIQIRTIHAPRGVIYDRNNKILAQNEPGFRIVEKGPNGSKVRFLTRDEALNLEVEGRPEKDLMEIDHLRSYPLGKIASHITGYVGEISQEELTEDQYKSYKLGDKIGRGGVEQTYEQVLKGIDGGEIIEVDAKGKRIRTIREVPPVAGQNIVLSIDSDLQREAFKLLEEGIKKAKSCCGALVAQDPNTGEVLSLVSYPSYDPRSIEGALIEANFPFLNRVISGTYPPGSVFKTVSSLAGLASSKITPQTVFEDTGVVQLGDSKFANWYFTQYGKTEGYVDMVKALQRSNDIYFYLLGQKIGEKPLADMANKLGLGEKRGIDLPGETEGLIPTDEWKQNYIGDVWYPGDTLHMSIGQGFILVTPLQVNSLFSSLATFGSIVTPRLALKITTPEGKSIKEFKSDIREVEGLREEYFEIVKKGLEKVTQSGGTAWPFFNFPIKTAGKTGTAEYGDPKGRTHAWYTGFAPADNTQITATAVIEGGGEGSSDASPIIKELFRWYFSSDKSSLIKDTYAEASPSARIGD